MLAAWGSFWQKVLRRTPLRRYANGEIWMKYRLWLHFLQLQPGYNGLILDVGCGRGALAIWLAQQFPAATVIGLDVKRESLAAARASQQAQGVTNVHFLQGSLLNLPFAAEAFPRAISTQVWEHLPPPINQTMLVEVHRVLGPDGLFVLNVPGAGFLRYRFPLYRLISWLRPSLKTVNTTLKAYWSQGTYDAWGLHGHMQAGFYPWDVYRHAPWGLSAVQYRYVMKFFGAMWFELSSITRKARTLLLPVSFLLFWLDDWLPLPGLDLSIQFRKIDEVPEHVRKA
ncbi:MAG: class I SAM-dependent methyltransferase [Anaerolineae bacterium]|nr:class I SAM-dependent methyltransferase [Anaerolineae bacterium]